MHGHSCLKCRDGDWGRTPCCSEAVLRQLGCSPSDTGGSRDPCLTTIMPAMDGELTVVQRQLGAVCSKDVLAPAGNSEASEKVMFSQLGEHRDFLCAAAHSGRCPYASVSAHTCQLSKCSLLMLGNRLPDVNETSIFGLVLSQDSELVVSRLITWEKSEWLMELLKSTAAGPWPGGSVGWSIIPYTSTAGG